MYSCRILYCFKEKMMGFDLVTVECTKVSNNLWWWFHRRVIVASTKFSWKLLSRKRFALAKHCSNMVSHFLVPSAGDLRPEYNDCWEREFRGYLESPTGGWEQTCSWWQCSSVEEMRGSDWEWNCSTQKQLGWVSEGEQDRKTKTIVLLHFLSRIFISGPSVAICCVSLLRLMSFRQLWKNLPKSNWYLYLTRLFGLHDSGNDYRKSLMSHADSCKLIHVWVASSSKFCLQANKHLNILLHPHLAHIKPNKTIHKSWEVSHLLQAEKPVEYRWSPLMTQ